MSAKFEGAINAQASDRANASAQPGQAMAGGQGVAAGGQFRFAEFLCQGSCVVTCKANERILNAIGMAPSDGRAFHLVNEARGIYPAPEKGAVKVVVICVRK